MTSNLKTDLMPEEYQYSEAKKTLAYLQDKIEKEKKDKGTAQHGTLSRYNRMLAQKELFNGDLGLAEKYLLVSFGELNESYAEAKQISDSAIKARVMSNISADHKKLVKLFIKIKLSYSLALNLQTILNLYSALKALININLLKNAEVIWIDIIEGLNNQLKNELLDIAEADEIVEFIKNELLIKLILDKRSTEDILWAIVRIYSARVKQDRKHAMDNPRIAEQVSIYRFESAQILRQLGRTDGAIEDLADSYLYDILNVESLIQWERKFKKYVPEFSKIKQKQPNKTRFIDYLYISIYVKGANVARSLPDRLKYLKKAIRSADQAGAYIKNFLDLHLQLYELLNILNTANNLNDIENKFQKNPVIDIGESKFTDNNLKVYKLYTGARTLIERKPNDTYESDIPALNSLYVLLESGVITLNEKITYRLLAKAISKYSEIDLTEDNLINDTYPTLSRNIPNDLSKLEEYLRHEEGSNVEVKLNDVAKTVEAICAFANTKGGTVIVGLVEKRYFSKTFPDKEIGEYRIIAQNFVLIGSRVFDDFRQKMASHIKANAKLHGIDVNYLYESKILDIDGKYCLAVEVTPVYERRGLLISVNNEVFCRYDNQNRKLTSDEIIERMATLPMKVHPKQ